MCNKYWLWVCGRLDKLKQMVVKELIYVIKVILNLINYFYFYLISLGLIFRNLIWKN
jgi:hypothetical protein